MVNIKKSRSESQQWACTSEDYTFPDETISTNTCGAAPARGVCEQYSDLDAAGITPNRSAEGKKRHRSSSPPPLEQRKSKQGKIAKEKASRSNQTTCLQYMEDFLDCAVGWHAPKKQTPGNVKRSGMAGDKQQTMEAIIILCDVLVRQTISPIEPQPRETYIQAVMGEAKHQIETHLRGDSGTVLPTCSLMADAAFSGDSLRTIVPDHEPCLPDETSSCVNCRKQRRRMAYECNLKGIVGEAQGDVVRSFEQ
jgi:hypothetical protein